jgi:hypothetical protein
MVNCTLPRDLYKKCLNGLPGTMSVHMGRPCWTAVRIASIDPLRCKFCGSTRQRKIRLTHAILSSWKILVACEPDKRYDPTAEGM